MLPYAGATPPTYNGAMTTLFISDLHLDPSRPEITRLFGDFLDGQARGAEALYILGDLFEAWVGDDDPSETGARSEEHTSELQSLMRISYAVFCLKKQNIHQDDTTNPPSN